MTLSELLNLWLDTYIAPKRARKTVEAYRYALAHLSRETMQTPISELTPLQLQREINQLAAEYSRQAQLMFIALRASMNRAVRLGMMASNPADLCDPPAHEPADINYMTLEEARAYLAAAEGHPHGALLILMLCLGLRRNEARALHYGDLGADGILRIRRQLTRDGLAPLKSRASKRDIPLPEALRAIFTGDPGDYIDPCSETALRRAHLAILARAGIDRNVTLHGLRHTCATLTLRSGGQLVTIQRLLGHAHFGVTADIYCHIDRHMIAMATGQLIRYLSHGAGARLEIV